ncbi:hypothetical protein NON08_00095 [Cetobacterium somerae]|uniref:hypothetical protein n=1 Tax=Cetobacterium sp. NK01 TaxID=2993530 RepID=UPI00211605DE|nr:hypothetical protein [Cetobacterium sp. NK01]MCQ8210971.1 hypothetical protein [Cetobacterium sp. NK01]
MKKLLFGLLALSAATFAANPGTATSADMQVQARLAIVDATDKLVIEELNGIGNWGVVSSVVSFDHGSVTKGTTIVPNPTLLRKFRVRKPNSTGGNSSLGTVAVTLDGNNTGTSTGTLTSGANSIPHTFKFTSAPVAVSNIANFDIESMIPTLAADKAVGIYSRVQTVEVKVTP